MVPREADTNELPPLGCRRLVCATMPERPPANLTSAEFEVWVATLFRSNAGPLPGVTVSLHDRVNCPDGSYEFDATIRYQVMGLDFLVIVEAKQHVNPIKRELVQVLHQKVQSVGAQKGVMVATARYQSGALEFAAIHGIALVTVMDGQLAFGTRNGGPVPSPERSDSNTPLAVGYVIELDALNRETTRDLLNGGNGPGSENKLHLPGLGEG
jgi:hypothetical protein